MYEEYLPDSKYESYYPELAGIRRSIASHLPLRPGMRILDVATGYGFFALEVAAREKSVHVLGIDISKDSVAHARRNIESQGLGDRVQVIRADIADLGLSGETFDLAVNFAGLEDIHMTRGKSGVRQAFREVSRVLRRDGSFCYAVICPESLESEAQMLEAEVFSFVCGSTWLKASDYGEFAEQAGLRVTSRRDYHTRLKLTPEQARREIEFACENVPRLYSAQSRAFEEVWTEYGASIEEHGLGHYSKMTLFIADKSSHLHPAARMTKPAVIL